jgi:hypothetical protein
VKVRAPAPSLISFPAANMEPCPICEARDGRTARVTHDPSVLCDPCRETLLAFAGWGRTGFHIMHVTGWSFHESMEFASTLRLKPIPQPTLAELIALLSRHRPLAIEALWDGDSSGWHVRLAAWCSGRPSYDVHLGVLTNDAGDSRLFKQVVPPWPEAVTAKELGLQLAAHFRVPFWFPSPDYPEEGCPRWVDRHRAVPCRGCHIPLDPDEPRPEWGTCSRCQSG